MKNLIILVLTLATAFAIPSKKKSSHKLEESIERPKGRITLGLDADEQQFPYQVGLSLKTNNLVYWCGGSILNNEWVLTAAHCTRDVIEAQVFMGSAHYQSGEVKHLVKAKDIIVHEDYNSKTVQNDISLIKIPYTEYTDNIQPVKLPALGQYYADYSGESVIASGWGRTNDTPGSSPDILQWARLDIIPNKICVRYFREVSDNNICTATIGGVNICNGDSGGPIVLETGKILVGLTSFGAESCFEAVPSVFTRITSYLEWIKQFTGIAYQLCSN